MCRAHAAVRGMLGALVGGASSTVVLDMEAGLEQLSRGTPRDVDAIVAILEPYYRSLETGARVLALAEELGIERRHAIANKVRDGRDAEAIRAFCDTRGIGLLATLPFDDAVADADREGPRSSTPRRTRRSSQASARLRRRSLRDELNPAEVEP